MSVDKLFNIDILSPSKQDVRFLGQIMKLNIFGTGNDFEEEGLFSTTIYGPVGSKERNKRFGYIDLGVPLLHPLVYSHAIGLNTLFKEIIHGETRAVFNEKLGEFEKVPDTVEGVGGTGLHFFLKYIDKLDLETGKSDQRDFHIELMKKYSDANSLIQYMLVMPAGFRDYIVKGGKPTEDEINDKYRAVLSIANNLVNMKITPEDVELYNPIIISMQKLFLDIYLHFKNILSDKKGFLQDKFAKRGVKYGTRNVITPSTNLIDDLDGDNVVGFNDTITGLKQLAYGIKPITKNKIKTVFINRIINPDSNSAYLFNTKTFEVENTLLSSKHMKLWTTFEGLEGVISKLKQDAIRNGPVLINDKALLMVRDTGDAIEIIFPTENIKDTKNVRPISYFELIYLALYDVRNKYPAMLTRYPVTGVGSTYLTSIYVKTTVVDRKIELTVDGETRTVYNYPILSEKPFNALSPHYTRLERLGADHDGDMVTLNFLMLNEVLKESEDIFKNIDYYIDTNGSLTFSTAIHPANLVMKHLTDTLDTNGASILTFKEQAEEMGKGKLIDAIVKLTNNELKSSTIERILLSSDVEVMVKEKDVIGFISFNAIDKPEDIEGKHKRCINLVHLEYSDEEDEILDFIRDGISSIYTIVHKSTKKNVKALGKIGFKKLEAENHTDTYILRR